MAFDRGRNPYHQRPRSLAPSPGAREHLAPETRGYPEFNPAQPRDGHGRFSSGGPGDAAAEAIKSSGGFTIDPRTGTSPSKGFVVAVQGHGATLNGDAFLSNREARTRFVADWLKREKAALSEPGREMGGWIDTETGLVYLDVVEVKSSRAAAAAAARQRGEIAFYDLAGKQEIRV